MKSLFLTLVAALIAIAAVSQTPQPTPPARINTGVIEGIVTRTGTPPEPISGVQIQLNIAGAIRGAGLTPDVTVLDATSDDAGHFVFKDLYPGQYQLRYQREGFFPVRMARAAQIYCCTNAPPPTRTANSI